MQQIQVTLFVYMATASAKTMLPVPVCGKYVQNETVCGKYVQKGNYGKYV